MLIKRLSAFALLTSLALPFSALADITGGIDWLATQPNADGSFGATPTSLATSVQTTAEVLRAYQVTGQITQPAYAPALAYVNADPETNTEFLARKIMVNVGAGTDVTALANALVANQNQDGGLGDQPGYASSVLDTALALQALAAANYTSGPIVSAAAGHLLNRQQANGGWADGENATSIYVSAAAMRALWYYRNTYQGVTASLGKAQNFLLSQRAADGLWGEHFISASALIALVPNVSDLSLIASAATALAGAQQANGSWSDDAYTTALALQALRAYELRAAGASPTTGSLSGYVLKAGSTEPVVGATVSLRERPSAAVTTNGDGYYSLGGYSCVIKGEINGDLKTLAFGGFQVIEPPIKIDAELKTGTQGRVLILLDPASSCGGTCLDDTDPHGPESAPGLTNQRLFLEALLKNNGWSYTIVENAEAFTFELRSGNYNLYALFNEQEKLSEQAQKELREAIFRGEGLLVAGAHDHRELHTNKLLDALGIDATGHDPKASEIEFTQSALNLTGKLALLTGDHILRIEPLSAVSAARYTNPSNGNHTPESVTINSYGTGKAAFAAFDLIALATIEGDQGLAAKLILNALTWADPGETASLTGTVKAIDLTLTNQGIATTAIATVTLPAGVTVLDANGGTLTGNTLAFTTPLDVEEVKPLTFWVKLPSTAGSITLDATVTAEEHPEPLAAPSLTLTVTTRDLNDAKTTLDALLTADHPNAKELKKAGQSLERALTAATTAHAVLEALKATDDLLGLTDPEIVALRQSIDAWLRIVSQQL